MAEPVIDPTFYRSAAEAAAAPGEQLAYVVAFDRAGKTLDRSGSSLRGAAVEGGIDHRLGHAQELLVWLPLLRTLPSLPAIPCAAHSVKEPGR